MKNVARLPLLPLYDEVHFPCTELRIHVVEPEYREMIEDLFMSENHERRIGIVLLKPDWVEREDDESDVFPAGTAARLVGLDLREDGCEVLLHGEFRFEVEREIGGGPCRVADVRQMDEPELSELDPEIRGVRSEIVRCISQLASELGEQFILTDDQLDALDEDISFEELVNRLAADLDLTPLRKLRLLSEALPERALHLLSILRNRRRVLDALRPYRHLAEAPEFN